MTKNVVKSLYIMNKGFKFKVDTRGSNGNVISQAWSFIILPMKLGDYKLTRARVLSYLHAGRLVDHLEQVGPHPLMTLGLRLATWTGM